MLIHTHFIEKKCINWPIWYISATKTKHAVQLLEEERGGGRGGAKLEREKGRDFGCLEMKNTLKLELTLSELVDFD